MQQPIPRSKRAKLKAFFSTIFGIDEPVEFDATKPPHGNTGDESSPPPQANNFYGPFLPQVGSFHGFSSHEREAQNAFPPDGHMITRPSAPLLQIDSAYAYPPPLYRTEVPSPLFPCISEVYSPPPLSGEVHQSLILCGTHGYLLPSEDNEIQAPPLSSVYQAHPSTLSLNSGRGPGLLPPLSVTRTVPQAETHASNSPVPPPDSKVSNLYVYPQLAGACGPPAPRQPHGATRHPSPLSCNSEIQGPPSRPCDTDLYHFPAFRYKSETHESSSLPRVSHNHTSSLPNSWVHNTAHTSSRPLVGEIYSAPLPNYESKTHSFSSHDSETRKPPLSLRNYVTRPLPSPPRDKEIRSSPPLSLGSYSIRHLPAPPRANEICSSPPPEVDEVTSSKARMRTQ